MVGKTEARRQLIQTILTGAVEEVESFLNVHPEAVDAPDSHHNTPIRAAIKRGRLEFVQLLVERGANPSQTNQGGSGLLDLAIRCPSRAIVEYLVTAGCALEPYHAAQLGDLQALESLVEQGEGALDSCDPRGGSLLHAAARGDQVVVSKWLLARGADVNRANKHGVPPLGDAVEFGALGVASSLLDHGADPNGRAGHFQGTVLHRAVFHKSRELVRLLLERGADPDRQDGAGKTALHQAVAVGTVELVELILARGPDLDLRTVRGIGNSLTETALELARRRGPMSIVQRIEAALSSP